MSEASDILNALHAASARKRKRLKELAPISTFDADGKLVWHRREKLQVEAPPAPVVQKEQVPAVATNLQVGDKLEDGTVYAGELNGKKIFAAPEDAKLANRCALLMTFNEAARYAETQNKENYYGHNDWRVPTVDELNLLYTSKDKGFLKGQFDETGESPSGWYGSSSTGDYSNDFVKSQCFSNGRLAVFNSMRRMSVRLVRG
jgi:hypothetical protein